MGDVLKMLELASANMREVSEHASLDTDPQAESASNWDRVGGGMMMDMMERSAIAQAQNCVDRARLISTQAESLSPGIGTLSHLQMPQGNLMSDMLFDNYFTDTAFHYKIQAANGLLLRARATVQSQTLATVQQRVRDAQASKQRAGAALFAAREALERLRSDIMATQGGTASIPTAAPPTYAR